MTCMPVTGAKLVAAGSSSQGLSRRSRLGAQCADYRDGPDKPGHDSSENCHEFSPSYVCRSLGTLAIAHRFAPDSQTRSGSRHKAADAAQLRINVAPNTIAAFATANRGAFSRAYCSQTTNT